MTKPLLKRLTRGFNVPSKSDKEAAKASGNPDAPQSNNNPGPTLQHVRNEKQSVQGHASDPIYDLNSVPDTK